jgi:TolB protein
MRGRLTTAFLAVILLTAVGCSTEKVPDSGKSPQAAQTGIVIKPCATTEELVRQLGSEDVFARESAEKKLANIGRKMIEQYRSAKLRNAADEMVEERGGIETFAMAVSDPTRGSDAEVKMRATRVLEPLYGLAAPKIVFVIEGIRVTDQNGRIEKQIAGGCSPVAWSPDGTRIAFAKGHDSAGPVFNSEIYVVDADGANPVRLTDSAARDFGPSWSPDGTRIAFVSQQADYHCELWVMDADGANQRSLAGIDGGIVSWSPDSRHIAFESLKAGTWHVCVIDPDGTNMKNLSEKTGGRNHAWIPGTARIAFVSPGLNDVWRKIRVMDADGGNETSVIASSEIMSPAWSPDGNMIAFTSFGQHNWNVCVMNSDGTGERRLSDNIGVDVFPRWSPDGSKLAYISDIGSNWQLCVADVKTGARRCLTRNPPLKFGVNSLDGSAPCWCPALSLEEISVTFSDALDRLSNERNPQVLDSRDLPSSARELIQLLVSEDFSTREGATLKLAGLGQAALPELEAAYNEATDPEVRSRLEMIADRMDCILDPAERDSVNRLVGDLYSPDAAKRVEAFDRLVGEGRGAIKALKKALENPAQVEVTLTPSERTCRVGDLVDLTFTVKNTGTSAGLLSPNYAFSRSMGNSNEIQYWQGACSIGWGGAGSGVLRPKAGTIRECLRLAVVLPAADESEIVMSWDGLSQNSPGVFSASFGMSWDNWSDKQRTESYEGISIVPVTPLRDIYGSVTVCFLPKEEDCGNFLKLSFGRPEYVVGEPIDVECSFVNAERLQFLQVEVPAFWYIILDGKTEFMKCGGIESVEPVQMPLTNGQKASFKLPAEFAPGEYQMLIGYGDRAFSQIEKVKVVPAK